MAPFEFGSFSRGCGKNRGSGKGPPSRSERSTPYRKETSRFLSTKQKKTRNPSTHPSGKSAPFPPRERKYPVPFEEHRERLDPRKENRNGRTPSSKVEKGTRSNPSTKQTGSSFPPRERKLPLPFLGKENAASTFSLLFLPFPPHFLPKLPSGGLTNPLRKNILFLPSRPPPRAESSICTHTEIL